MHSYSVIEKMRMLELNKINSDGVTCKISEDEIINNTLNLFLMNYLGKQVVIVRTE